MGFFSKGGGRDFMYQHRVLNVPSHLTKYVRTYSSDLSNKLFIGTESQLKILYWSDFIHTYVHTYTHTKIHMYIH